MKADIVPHWQN